MSLEELGDTGLFKVNLIFFELSHCLRWSYIVLRKLKQFK